MNRLTRTTATLVRHGLRRLPPHRRDWAEALLAETAEVPAGRQQLSWLAGGLWLVAKPRIAPTAAILVAGGATVWLGWWPGSTNPATPVNRIFLVATVLMLAVLPWFGRAGASRAARVVRAGGYAGVCGILLVTVLLARFAGARFEHFHAFNQANWEADMVQGAIVSSVVLFALLAAYAIGILVTTARRSSITPTTLTIGAVAGVVGGFLLYAMTPFGGTLRVTPPGLAVSYHAALVLIVIGAPVAAGWAAARRTVVPGPEDVAAAQRTVPPRPENVAAARNSQSAAAGLWTGGAAALVITILTISTMLIFPDQVPLEWANPDPSVPHGTAFEIQMSVSDAAARYLVVLFVAPLFGAVFGLLGVALPHRRQPS